MQPNTTSAPRECIVNCYVTNSQNSSDEDKVLMPVRIHQDGGSGAASVSPSSLRYAAAGGTQNVKVNMGPYSRSG